MHFEFLPFTKVPNTFVGSSPSQEIVFFLKYDLKWANTFAKIEFDIHETIFIFWQVE